MKINIKIRPLKINGKEVTCNDNNIELMSIWNRSTTFSLHIDDMVIELNGKEVIDSINRIINRPYGCTD